MRGGLGLCRRGESRSFRWLPRDGEPSCVGEWLSQYLVRALAYLPIYTALVATLVLLVLVFGVPFLGGR